MRPQPDLRLYLITDRALAAGRPIEEVVAAAVRGGVTAVQLREKDCPTAEFVALARRLKALLAPHGVPLLINDRVDVALAAHCDGVHIGQSDMAYKDARALLGPEAIIGVSVQTPAHAEAALRDDCDYLGLGPVFATATKPDAASPCGLEGVQALRALTKRTLVAIGGINEDNAASVIAAGADSLAVVSALCAASDPERAAAHLRARIDAALRNRRKAER
jgi:thiamine-phosphate pyrophosphorylase